MADKKIGIVKHYFNKIGVAAIVFKAKLSVGDKVKFVRNGKDKNNNTLNATPGRRNSLHYLIITDGSTLLGNTTLTKAKSPYTVPSGQVLTVAGDKTLTIEPWDKSLLGAVEKGVRDSGLGVNPVNDGRLIRLNLPELTSDRRQELIKVLHQKLEQARISARKIREDVRARARGDEAPRGPPLPARGF